MYVEAIFRSAEISLIFFTLRQFILTWFDVIPNSSILPVLVPVAVGVNATGFFCGWNRLFGSCPETPNYITRSVFLREYR